MGHKTVLANARVVDGTGASWFRGHVAVDYGQVVTVVRGEDHGLDAEEVIDVEGAVVCPGFIDTHSHSDLQVFSDPSLRPKIRQGITTEVIGQDGFSMAPMCQEDGAAEWGKHLVALAGDIDVEWTWGEMSEYLDAIKRNGIAPNVGTLIGHGTVRYNVLGMDSRSPDEAELEEMADLVTESLEQGALGFSTGLVYSPQVNATTNEVQTLAARLVPFGRPFVAHIRSEGRWIWDALDEFIDIGDEESIPLHLSHYKVAGQEQQGKASRSNAILEAARERGVDITAEQYPYAAGNTMLASVLPPWVEEGGPSRVIDRLSDPDARARIKHDINEWRIDGWENPAARTEWKHIVVTNIDSPEYQQYEGQDVITIAQECEADPVDVVCDMLVEEELAVSMIPHITSEPDVREIMSNERVCIATDGLFSGRPHPRTYGTYPRVLGTYVRQEGLLTLEEAVRKMTSLPARAMGLGSKGIIRPGMDADLVVFDPVAVGSPADYDSPRQYPRGIHHVLVAGEFVVRNEEATGLKPGSVLRT